MNPDTLLARFDQISEAPEAIPRLRRFILDLAVRGKLVPQDPNDEPAEKLLARVDGWRADAVQRKLIREPRKHLKEIEPHETPYLLPNGWAWTRLGNIIYIQSGEGLTAANMQDGDIPVYGGNGVNGYHDAFNVTEPTIVIGRVGYYCGSVHVTPERAWVTDNAFITRFCLREIFLEFLVLLLKCTNLKENENATAQPVISGSKIYSIVIGIPPLPEQHRIVAKVDELMALCDELETVQNKREKRCDRLVAATLNSLNNGTIGEDFHDKARFYFNHLPRLTTRPEHIQQLRQTILSLAVRGKLIPQDPDDEPVSTLLKLIKGQQRSLAKEGVIGRGKRTLEISLKDIPNEIPSSWQWVKLGSLTIGMTNGIYKPASFYSDDGIICLRMYNIRGGQVNFESPKRMILSDSELQAYELLPGDLLVNRVNSRELVGKAAVVPRIAEKLIFESKNIRVRLIDSDSLPKYCNLLFQTAFYRNIIEGYSNKHADRQL